jgi:hypothetical protein
MNSFFIKKILPVLSGFLLLASLFFILKISRNKAEVILKKELVQNYESTNRITNHSNLIFYEKMEGMTRKHPSNDFLTEAINEVIQISQKTKVILQDVFKNSSTEQNSKINQAVYDYKTSICTLLDSFERESPIFTSQDMQTLKSALHSDTIIPFSRISQFQKSILLNNINTSSLNLISYFSSRIGTVNMTYHRFNPIISLSAVAQNTQIFKIYLNHPSASPRINNIEIYSEIESNKLPIESGNYETKVQIPIKSNSIQRVILSANWEIPNHPKLNTTLTNSISDTFTITPFN